MCWPVTAKAWSYEDLPEEPPTYEELVAKVVETMIEQMDEEIDMLAKLVYTEARGVKSKAEQAAVIWCALNRVDCDRYPDTIKSVVTQRHQFAYRPKTPVREQIPSSLQRRADRWLTEKFGIEDVGRVLLKHT